MNTPIQAKKFNQQQSDRYKDYCDKCRLNGIEPEPQSRYFAPVGVTYGYVVANRFGEIHWRKRKKDFNF